MPFEHKPGQGSLFKNDRKEQDTHPDYNGTLVLPDGTECWLNAWLKDGGRGKFFSLSVRPKDAAPKKPEPSDGDLEDEIPF